MCTYQTQTLDVRASGKLAGGWAPLTSAAVYFDHPVHFAAGHALMIDVRSSTLGPGARVALEMDAPSARALAQAILQTLASVPDDLQRDSLVAGRDVARESPTRP
ncbi:MAG: hypothetical protein HIU57_08795 [Acidobacteria bacterium]|nr:hypothetical protein [Acidobacteriota bacterium]